MVAATRQKHASAERSIECAAASSLRHPLIIYSALTQERDTLAQRVTAAADLERKRAADIQENIAEIQRLKLKLQAVQKDRDDAEDRAA